jgi:predicted ATPase
VLKEFAAPDARAWLASDGANLPSIVKRLSSEFPTAHAKLVDYLAAVVPGIADVRHVPAANRETLQYRLQMDNRQDWPFFASSMSDGTLRATALLAALFQPGLEVVGIEEPEISLHPKATHALAEAITEVAEHKQVLVTTHSPEFVAHPGIEPANVYLVGMRRGVSEIAAMPEGLRDVVESGVFTLPELQRLGQLVPEDAPPRAVARRIEW